MCIVERRRGYAKGDQLPRPRKGNPDQCRTPELGLSAPKGKRPPRSKSYDLTVGETVDSNHARIHSKGHFSRKAPFNT